MYRLGRGRYTVGLGCARAASLPLLRAMFLVMAVWVAIRRSWWVIALSPFMTAMTGLLSVLSWIGVVASADEVTGYPPARTPQRPQQDSNLQPTD